MVYFESFEEFQAASREVYARAPRKVRCLREKEQLLLMRSFAVLFRHVIVANIQAIQRVIQKLY